MGREGLVFGCQGWRLGEAVGGTRFPKRKKHKLKHSFEIQIRSALPKQRDEKERKKEKAGRKQS